MLIVDSHQKLAPRVGFAFPISDKAKLMFNYGHFYQRPGFSKYYQRATQASNAFSGIGNANIDYEKTILYEVGVQYAIAEGYRLDLSGYYKDQYGLLNTIPVSLPSGIKRSTGQCRLRQSQRVWKWNSKSAMVSSSRDRLNTHIRTLIWQNSSDRSDYYNTILPAVRFRLRKIRLIGISAIL
jgi:outer membrane receptor protein involved in Fe transport